MNPMTTLSLPSPPPLIQALAIVAALLAAVGSVGTIDALALHYAARLQQATTSIARHGAEPDRCSAPAERPAARVAS